MHLDLTSNLSLDIFLMAVAAMFTIGISAVVKNVWLPAGLQFEEIMEGAWDEKLQKRFQKYDDSLKPMGYRPLLNFTVLNLQNPNIVRVYSNPMDPAFISVVSLGNIDAEIQSAKNFVEITTRYTDGTILDTRNGDIDSIMEKPANQLVQALQGMEDLTQLKAVHDKRAEEHKARGPFYLREGNLERYLELFQEHHSNFCRVNQAAGTLRFDEKANLYRATPKAAIRAILNILNPLADNFTWARFLMVCAFAFAPILSLSLFWEPLQEWLSGTGTLDGNSRVLLPLILTYGLAGVVIGAMFREKSFIWAFLLGYGPARMLSSFIPAWFLLDLGMVLAAETVAYFRRKKETFV